MLNNFDLHDRGMDYVSELLTDQNWNVEVMRNGQDDYLQINRPESETSYRIKVKALSKENPVPFHTRSPDSINADFLVICRNLESNNPEIFTADMQEVKNVVHEHGGDYWLETNDYEKFGRGFARLESN